MHTKSALVVGILLLTMLAVGLPWSAEASITPPSGSVVVKNDLSLVGGSCQGSASIGYGFLAEQRLRTWSLEIDPQTCVVTLLESTAAASIFRPIGEVPIGYAVNAHLNGAHPVQAFNSASIISYPIAPCSVTPIQISTPVTSYTGAEDPTYRWSDSYAENVSNPCEVTEDATFNHAWGAELTLRFHAATTTAWCTHHENDRVVVLGDECTPGSWQPVDVPPFEIDDDILPGTTVEIPRGPG